MYKYIGKDTKEEILKRIKEDGAKVSDMANQYGLSEKTIYKWMSLGVVHDNSSLEISRLNRKIKELQEIIGELVVEQKVIKKKKY